MKRQEWNGRKDLQGKDKETGGCDYQANGQTPKLPCGRCYRKTGHSFRDLNRSELSAACRAKSTADMINKLKIVEEEADETEYWLEILVETGITSKEHVADIHKEANEILAMTVASIKTLRNRKQS